MSPAHACARSLKTRSNYGLSKNLNSLFCPARIRQRSALEANAEKPSGEIPELCTRLCYPYAECNFGRESMGESRTDLRNSDFGVLIG
jgi:hypothetical protein